MRHRITIPLMASLIALSACRSFPGLQYKVEGAPPQHIVYIDTHGRLVDPTGDTACYKGDNREGQLHYELSANGFSKDQLPQIKSELCLGEFTGLKSRVVAAPDVYFQDIFDAMRQYHEKATLKPEQQRLRRVALIIHGGLNDNRGNIEAARDVSVKMLADQTAPYPVFINWQSNLWGSLFDHLVKVRQGDAKGFKHSFLFPFYLASDLARGIARAPATWFYHYDNDLKRLKKKFLEPRTRADKIYSDLRQEYLECVASGSRDCEVFPISAGPSCHTYWEGARSTTRNASTNLVPIRYYAQALGRRGGSKAVTWLPMKLIVAPFLDGLGTPAWNTMNRHVQVAFHNDGVPNPKRSIEPEQTVEGLPARTVEFPEGNGGVAKFMRALRDEIHETSCNGRNKETCLTWELTLIAHSMGAIMANEILYEFKEGPEFKNIVYMAAACSIRDYERSVLEYLKVHGNTQFYHLTLDDFAEIRDQYFFELPPSGSLLVWIDNFLSNPATLRDRTAGRYSNLMLSLPSTPRNLRSRIHVRTFGVGEMIERSDPQHHGDFNDLAFRFWDSSFWTPEGAGRDCPTTTSPVPSAEKD